MMETLELDRGSGPIRKEFPDREAGVAWLAATFTETPQHQWIEVEDLERFAAPAVEPVEEKTPEEPAAVDQEKETAEPTRGPPLVGAPIVYVTRKGVAHEVPFNDHAAQAKAEAKGWKTADPRLLARKPVTSPRQGDGEAVPFREWLRAQEGINGPIGDLASDVAQDSNLPDTYAAMKAHLEERAPGLVELVEMAHSRWRDSNADAARLVARETAPDDTFGDTEAGHAEFFAAFYGESVRYDHAAKRWFVFDGHHWRPDPDGEVDRLLLQSARARQRAAVGDAARLKKMTVAESGSVLVKTERLARAVKPLATDGESWNPDPSLLGVENGVVDLRTGELRDGVPADMITRWIPVRYDQDARAERWERFIDEIFTGKEGLAEYMQRVIGYTLTGDVEEQCFWVLYGEGANGKSTFIETLMRMFGDYSFAMDFPSSGWSESSSEYQRAEMYGKRLVSSSEVSRRGHLNERFVKSITGGDELNARHPYGRPFTFRPEAKLFLRVNHKPRIADQSHAMWRRVKLIEFDQTFSVDPTLAETLLAEREGILRWAVAGCLAWRAGGGLHHPECVKAASEAYQAESDELAEFLAERCLVEEGAAVRAKELFSAYRGWCDSVRLAAEDRMSLTAFGYAIQKRFRSEKLTRPRSKRGVWYYGIEVDHQEQEDAPF